MCICRCLLFFGQFLGGRSLLGSALWCPFYRGIPLYFKATLSSKNKLPKHAFERSIAISCNSGVVRPTGRRRRRPGYYRILAANTPFSKVIYPAIYSYSAKLPMVKKVDNFYSTNLLDFFFNEKRRARKFRLAGFWGVFVTAKLLRSLGEPDPEALPHILGWDFFIFFFQKNILGSGESK